MRWLVTGGCGFIGTNLVKYIFNNDKKAKVTIVDNLVVGKKENAHPLAVLVTGNVTDGHLALRICDHIDIVVHLAANTGVLPSIEDPALDCYSNVIGTFNYLEAARRSGVKKFIFASSGGAAVGNKTPPINEEIVPAPISPYGASKVSGEAYCSAYHGAYGLATYALRFSNVYGPHSEIKKGNLIPNFIMAAINKKQFRIYGDGSQTRDFIYVEDLVSAIALVAASDCGGGEIFQVATGKPTSVLGIVECLNGITGDYVDVTFDAPRAGEVKNNYLDISKIKKVLGFVPKIDIRIGLERTFAWFLEKLNPYSKTLSHRV